MTLAGLISHFLANRISVKNDEATQSVGNFSNPEVIVTFEIVGFTLGGGVTKALDCQQSRDAIFP
jgi:hypothetical protein